MLWGHWQCKEIPSKPVFKISNQVREVVNYVEGWKVLDPLPNDRGLVLASLTVIHCSHLWVWPNMFVTMIWYLWGILTDCYLQDPKPKECYQIGYQTYSRGFFTFL